MIRGLEEQDPEEGHFPDKATAREHVWETLARERAAAFPFPIRGRIPNFRGAARAAERLLAHPAVAGARRLKVNPDAPQRPFRRRALAQGIELVLPAPRLAAAFRVLDPRRIPPQHLDEAATLAGAERWGEPRAPADLPRIDAVITGSVAVTRDGRRCGKGHGYGDLEFALLRELGHPPVPVLTSVHPLQLVGAFPADRHDLPVHAIVTPDETIEVRDPPAPPNGIDWSALDREALAAMPALEEVRRAREEGGHARG
jgi:5-formyltetrahydrofolate cyclo-ligase